MRDTRTLKTAVIKLRLSSLFFLFFFFVSAPSFGFGAFRSDANCQPQFPEKLCNKIDFTAVWANRAEIHFTGLNSPNRLGSRPHSNLPITTLHVLLMPPPPWAYRRRRNQFSRPVQNARAGGHFTSPTLVEFYFLYIRFWVLLFQARRQLSAAGYLSDQESIHSVSLGTRPSNGRITPNTGSGMVTVGDRGSCSADSGVRGSSDRESGATSAGGNLSDSTADGTLYRPSNRLTLLLFHFLFTETIRLVVMSAARENPPRLAFQRTDFKENACYFS